MFSSERSGSYLTDTFLFRIKKNVSIKINFLEKTFKKLGFICSCFFKLLPKFSDFIVYDAFIVKITPKSIRLYVVFIQNNIWSKKIIDFSSEKMLNSGNSVVSQRWPKT